MGLALGGWLVFPLHHHAGDGRCSCGDPLCFYPQTKTAAKHPRTKNGLHDATSDPAQVMAWWAKWPEANIGVRTGDGMFVVDVDGEAGWEFLKERELPVTKMVRTGRGVHLWFWVPDGVTVRNRSKVGPELDVRGDGGYVLAPPSEHASGAVYEWVDEAVPIADAPAWLVELVRERPYEAPPKPIVPTIRTPESVEAYARAALNGEVQRVLDAGDGAQNDTLNTAAFALGQLVGAGALPESVVVRALLDAWDALEPGNGPGMRKGAATIRSGLEAGKRQPRQIPERSEQWQTSHAQIATDSGADVPHATDGASSGTRSTTTSNENVTSKAIGTTFTTLDDIPERPPDKRESPRGKGLSNSSEGDSGEITVAERTPTVPSPNGARPHVEYPLGVWPGQVAEFIEQTASSVCVAPEAVGTCVLAVAASVIGRTRWLDVKGEGGWIERPGIYAGLVGDVSRRKSPALRAAKAPLEAIHKERAASWQREHELWEETPGKTPEPQLESPLMKDVTTEVLALALKAHPRGVVMVADELVGWLNSMGQYKGGKGNDRQRWVEAWNGDLLDVFRVSRKRIVVENPCVSVIGGVQPDVFAGLTAVRDGLAERFLYCVLPKVPVAADTPDVPRNVRGTWEGIVRALYELKEAEVVCEVPGCLTEARQRAIDLERDAPEELEGYFGKGQTHLARIAIVLSAMWEVCGGEYGLTSAGVDRAEDLWAFYAEQARDLFMGDVLPVKTYIVASPALERAVLRHLEKHGGQATERDLMRGPLSHARGREATETLAVLISRGTIRKEPGQRKDSYMYVLVK